MTNVKRVTGNDGKYFNLLLRYTSAYSNNSIDTTVTQNVSSVNTYSMQEGGKKSISGTRISDADKKQMQFEIIQKSNPAPNDYLTWVRSAEDVRTYKKAWEYDELFTPDFTEEMATEALDKGTVKVYSSYPIKQGVFVTPSRMEAKGYSGTGKVYEKTVLLEDVAWISSLEGQYAKVDEKISPGVKGKKSVSGTRVGENSGLQRDNSSDKMKVNNNLSESGESNDDKTHKYCSR